MPSLDELADLDLGLHFFVDSNFPDDPTPSAGYLREMRDAHRIRLTLASVGEEELNTSNDQDVRELATQQDVALGIGVHGESRWGRSVWASEDDQQQLAAILAILTSTGASDEKMARDARHLQTAYRYGVRMFVTRDGEAEDRGTDGIPATRGILGKAEALRHEFNLRVMTPETAAAIVRHKAGDPPQS